MHLAKFRQEARAPENVYSVAVQKTAKHRAKFGWPPVSDIAAVRKPTLNPLMPQTLQTISAVSGPKFAILQRQLEEIRLSIHALVAKIQPDKVVR